MPELPEIERLRLDLSEQLPGAEVRSVRVARADVVSSGPATAPLLRGDRVASVARHGKQLALVGDSGRAVCVHLGMSGQVLVGRASGAPRAAHTHVVWKLADGREVSFRDPRRFGGLWTFGTLEELRASRWAALGPDALTIRGAQLRERLARTRRAVKAALLDQAVLAGVGNIYADEALFHAQVHPRRSAAELDAATVARLASSIRLILRRAIRAGGSTLRDYRRPDGEAGGFQSKHRVYGRGGEACVRCPSTLAIGEVAQRTTVWCPRCQPLLLLHSSQKR